MHDTTPENFAADVATGTTVVMFHAAWCGPCKGMKPLVEQLAAEQGFKLVGVDAGEHRTLAAVNNVRGVPTLAVFKNGALQAFSTGGLSADRLRSFLAAAGVPPTTE